MFNTARFKLTAWYVLIIMFISLAFSIAIYRGLSHEVDRFAHMQELRIERRLLGGDFQLPPPTPYIDNDLVSEIRERIILLLAIIDVSILLVSGGLSYVLAGKTLKPIKEMLEDQNRFVSDSSHELRTPLTSLKSTMEVSLRDKNFSLENAKQLISESIVEVNKLQYLSDKLLQLTQYQQQNNHIEFETVDIGLVINEAIRKISPLAKKKKIIIQKYLQNITLKGNKLGLIELIVILLDNAIKYSPRSSTIIVKTKKTSHSIFISVEDHGIGIAHNDIPHIFNRFFRADSARSKLSTGGYGLGLSIAKKIVDLHKGSIHVESVVKKGAMFIIRIPLKFV